MTIDTFAAQLTGSVDQILPLDESICSNDFDTDVCKKVISLSKHTKKVDALMKKIAKLELENTKLKKKLDDSTRKMKMYQRPSKIPK